ncbi:serine hydrolase domain-containing protein [Tautonia plasticadhaerens]|uniref:D-alanyl-D-alanine carboxypeptidase n=1 Tax=Tautonia plasticadhaerens TaxID=2527974 RepID=A0A518H4H0_9BACT|nr:serine hydrolase domain-containing protein [Tautonia plasticadhaerens]QDV35728.1 D-alanyl-D-alanine carboxypeptidase precursor [Tautonia plasticadhaerens]
MFTLIVSLLAPLMLAPGGPISGPEGPHGLPRLAHREDHPAGSPEVVALLEPIRARHELPALASAIMTIEGAVKVGAVGVRIVGREDPVTIEDRFHLGSCTKAMTATLLATFVEEGRLSWETTLAEALPDLEQGMHPDYRGATIQQILAHRAGFPGETVAPGLSLDAMRNLGDSMPRQRTMYLGRILAERPASPPGSEFRYSNRNYIVAGAIAERLGDASWEDLMRARLFEPLGMRTTGFGPSATRGRADQPWPHVLDLFGRSSPIPPGPGADNPALIGPAGTVHASLGDWGRFLACHLRSGKGEGGSPILRAESFARLHEKPDEGDYGFGWHFAEREWAGGTALTHAGSNTMNHAVVWFAPRRDFAVVAATNQGGEAASRACDEACSAMIDLHGRGGE